MNNNPNRFTDSIIKKVEVDQIITMRNILAGGTLHHTRELFCPYRIPEDLKDGVIEAHQQMLHYYVMELDVLIEAAQTNPTLWESQQVNVDAYPHMDAGTLTTVKTSNLTISYMSRHPNTVSFININAANSWHVALGGYLTELGFMGDLLQLADMFFTDSGLAEIRKAVATKKGR